VKAASAPEKSQ